MTIWPEDETLALHFGFVVRWGMNSRQRSRAPSWSGEDLLLLRLHWINDDFLQDVEEHLREYAPSEAKRRFTSGTTASCFDFALERVPRDKDAWIALAGDVRRLCYRWPHLPSRFWFGSLSKTFRWPPWLYQFGDRIVEDPAQLRFWQLPALPDARREEVRRDVGAALFAAVRLVIPVYPWTTKEELRLIAKDVHARRVELYGKPPKHRRQILTPTIEKYLLVEETLRELGATVQRSSRKEAKVVEMAFVRLYSNSNDREKRSLVKIVRLRAKLLQDVERELGPRASRQRIDLALQERLDPAVRRAGLAGDSEQAEEQIKLELTKLRSMASKVRQHAKLLGPHADY